MHTDHPTHSRTHGLTTAIRWAAWLVILTMLALTLAYSGCSTRWDITAQGLSTSWQLTIQPGTPTAPLADPKLPTPTTMTTTPH